MFGNDINRFDMNGELVRISITLTSSTAYAQPGHVDIPRIREGHLGGFFWSVFTECHDDGADFLTPNNHVRGKPRHRLRS